MLAKAMLHMGNNTKPPAACLDLPHTSGLDFTCMFALAPSPCAQK